MAQTDRTAGLVGHVGMKAPVKAATTANITLSGEQTIDGVACVDGDRVLVKDQSTASENGIYVVDTGTWSRAKDFNGQYDIVRGSLIKVNQGSVNGSGIFEVATSDPITIGSSSLSFSRLTINYVQYFGTTATAGQTVVNLGVSYQIGSSNLAVYLNGIRQRITDDYQETSSTSITFNFALSAGDQVDVYAGLQIGNLVAALASAVSIADAGDFFLATTVEAALQELMVGVTPDAGDADLTLTNGASSRVVRWATTLTANRTCTLSTTNAKEGARFTVIRTAGGNFTLAVGSLVTMRLPGEWCTVVYDAGLGAWILEAYGILPSVEVPGLSADNGDADVTLTAGSSQVHQRWATTLTARRTATLSSSGVYRGARFRITRAESATGNFPLRVLTGTTQLIRLGVGQWCEAVYNGSAWEIAAFGSVREPNRNLVTLYDDFVGEEIDSYRWQSLIGTDAEVRQATMLADQVNGVVRLVTGDDAAGDMATNGVLLQGRLNWRADKGCLVFEARVTMSAETNVAVFMGFTDQVSTLEMPFTLSGSTYTSNCTDGCGVLFDSAASATTWRLVGVAADTDAAHQNSAIGPVAGTFETWRVELEVDGEARFYRNGTLIGTVLSGAVTASVLLVPVIAAFSRGAASRNIDVDLISCQQLR